MDVSKFLTKDQQALIIQTISDAENNSSGEIRIHLESTCKEDVLDRATFIFKKLKMHKTALRNGVLIYLSVQDRKFAILGDVGINIKVPEGFWDQIKDMMISNFAKGEITTGLTEGIMMIGEKLKKFFPITRDDNNELSNEISF